TECASRWHKFPLRNLIYWFTTGILIRKIVRRIEFSLQHCWCNKLLELLQLGMLDRIGEYRDQWVIISRTYFVGLFFICNVAPRVSLEGFLKYRTIHEYRELPDMLNFNQHK
ncbi:unnamed protein product, partial [Auanema sp. JU1783]